MTHIRLRLVIAASQPLLTQNQNAREFLPGVIRRLHTWHSTRRFRRPTAMSSNHTRTPLPLTSTQCLIVICRGARHTHRHPSGILTHVLCLMLASIRG